MRKDAFEVGVNFVRPRSVCKRADAVGNADDGGHFVFRQSEPAPAKQPLHRAVGKAGQRGGQADGFGVAQIDGGDGVVAKVLICRLNVFGRAFGQERGGVVGRGGGDGGIESFAVDEHFPVREGVQTAYARFEADVRAEPLKIRQGGFGDDCAQILLG
ncbi:Uncharacterised protein [Neisseria meningitidis]|nr:Uncharacterised protein [Neisseria meningitidis]